MGSITNTCGVRHELTRRITGRDRMCRDDQCVPLPSTAVGAGRVDVEAFWRRLGNPVPYRHSPGPNAMPCIVLGNFTPSRPANAQRYIRHRRHKQ